MTELYHFIDRVLMLDGAAPNAEFVEQIDSLFWEGDGLFPGDVMTEAWALWMLEDDAGASGDMKAHERCLRATAEKLLLWADAFRTCVEDLKKLEEEVLNISIEATPTEQARWDAAEEERRFRLERRKELIDAIVSQRRRDLGVTGTNL